MNHRVGIKKLKDGGYVASEGHSEVKAFSEFVQLVEWLADAFNEDSVIGDISHLDADRQA